MSWTCQIVSDVFGIAMVQFISVPIKLFWFFFKSFFPLQKEWREDRHGAFKRKVARCVRKSQETAFE